VGQWPDNRVGHILSRQQHPTVAEITISSVNVAQLKITPMKLFRLTIRRQCYFPIAKLSKDLLMYTISGVQQPSNDMNLFISFIFL
jgi:hypothetical protein